MSLVVADLAWLSEQGQEVIDLESSLERKTHEVRKRQGEILLSVKEKLGHGNFTKWLKTLGWSDRTARHYIQQYKEVDKPKQLELIEAEVVEIEDDDLTESPHSKSASLAVLENAQRFAKGDLVEIQRSHSTFSAGFQSYMEGEFVIGNFVSPTQVTLIQGNSLLSMNVDCLMTKERLPILEAILDCPTNTPEGFTEYDDYPDGETLPIGVANQNPGVFAYPEDPRMEQFRQESLKESLKNVVLFALAFDHITYCTAAKLLDIQLEELGRLQCDIHNCFLEYHQRYEYLSVCEDIAKVAVLYRELFVKKSNTKPEYIKAFVDATDRFEELRDESD